MPTGMASRRTKLAIVQKLTLQPSIESGLGSLMMMKRFKDSWVSHRDVFDFRLIQALQIPPSAKATNANDGSDVPDLNGEISWNVTHWFSGIQPLQRHSCLGTQQRTDRIFVVPAEKINNAFIAP